MDAKKKTYGYRERDAAKRAAFLVQLAAIPPSQRVYMDESGMDERDDYGYGVRAVRGWKPSKPDAEGVVST